MREVAAWLPFDRVAGRRQEADGMGSDAMQASQVLREWCEEAMQGGAMRGGQLRRGQPRADPFEGGGGGGPASGNVTSRPGSQRGRCGRGVSVCGGPERKAYKKPTPQAGPDNHPATAPAGPGGHVSSFHLASFLSLSHPLFKKNII